MQIQSINGETWRPTPLAPTPPKPNSTYQLALTPSAPEAGSESDGEFQAFGDDGLSFFDFLDVINPLQHLPLIGPVYREFTGDELGPLPRVAGGALFFGPIGLVSSAIDVVSEQITGKDVAGNIMTVMKDEDAEAGTGRETVMVDDPAETLSVSSNTPVAAGTDAGEAIDPVSAWAMAELNFRQSEAEKNGLAVPARSYSHLLEGKSVPEVASAPTPAAEIVTATQTTKLQSDPQQIRRAAIAYGAAYEAASLSKPMALTPERPLASSDEPDTPATPRSPGSLAKDGGWFAQTMLDALAKSRTAEANPTATANGL